MLLSYCSLHRRLFVQHQQTWMNYSPKKVHRLIELFDLLCTANVNSPKLAIAETACDQCEEAILQILRVQRAQLDPPP